MLVRAKKEAVVRARRLRQKYLVVRTEELVIGRDVYRLEVLQCVYDSAERGVPAEPYSVRAYKRIAIEVRPAGRKMAPPLDATVWSAFTLGDIHHHQTEDRALEEAHGALLDEVDEVGP
jgi:hypothetical protein